MNAAPDIENNDESAEADRQAASMQDQLSKQVASWSKERKHQAKETFAAPPPPTVVQRRAPRRAAKPGTLAAVPKPVAPGSKPFGMSYSGMSQEEYTKYLYDRGFR